MSARAEPVSSIVPVELVDGPSRTGPAANVRFQPTELRQAMRFDVQDGRRHNVRGVSLRDLVTRVGAHPRVDTAVFVFADGMQIPVRLNDRREVDAIFIALQHGDEHQQFTQAYPIHGKADLTCPKAVYGTSIIAYSIWLYPGQLATIRLMNGKLYEKALAQATHGLARGAGWSLFLRHCQPCHGIGQQGATRGPDLLGNLPAYSRVAAWTAGAPGPHPSVHEKIKGYSDGTMPVLNHIPEADMATLWTWLHTLHDANPGKQQ